MVWYGILKIYPNYKRSEVNAGEGRRRHFADFAHGGKYPHDDQLDKFWDCISVLLAAMLLKSAGQGTLLPAG